MNDDSSQTRVSCPYCGETVEIFIEADVEGELIQDCEVCCNPWLVRIDRRAGFADVVARTLED